MPAAYARERPRRRRLRRRPAVVEQSVQRERALVEDDVLRVRVTDARQRRGDGQWIHSLPEEVARIEVRGEVRCDRREPLERFVVVDTRARVQLDADEQRRVLTLHKRGELAQVGE